ncbi:putative zinc finger protein, partial [Apostichopus japonicus]
MNEAELSASDDPKENKEASPETGDAENITDEQEIQFRCKLCHYTGKDKEEIASHFLSKHIAVEVRSIGRDDSNRGADGGFVEVTGSKKPNARKRGRPRREVKLKEEEEDVDDEDDESDKAFVHKPSQISISSRGRRRKIPFKFAVDADDDGSHPYLSSSRSSRRAESEETSVSEEAGTVKIEPNVEPNVEVSEDKEPEESSNGTHNLTENTEPPNEDSALETDEKDDEATEKVSDYVEIEMDSEYPEVKCEIESTKKRITKKRKSATDNDVAYDISGEKKKRHYVKSGEFSGNMADRQRALVAYACDLCGAKYNDLDDLEKHRGSHEEIDDEDGSTVMKCTECDGKFITSELLEEHVKQKHKRLLKLHRCHLCQFSSERRFDLKKHLVIHTGIKNYMCDQCGKCMSTPYNLKIHYLRLHATEEEKNITCSEDDCDFKCADKAVLKDHLRQKHNLMIDNRDSEKVEKIKLFSCKHCDYTGKKESSLRYHMRIHLENRQHKCKLCPYASKTKNNLILHMRTHDGMQPVKCSQCDFRGATNKIISEHILSKHAGIRPYRCLVCKWSTSYSGNMWKHIHDHRSELGDAMPAEPVEVVTGEGVAIPVPLRPPSGRKRTKLYPPRQYSRSPAADNLKAISKEFQAAHTARVDALSQLLQVNASGANPEETVTIVEVPIPMGEGESSVIMGGSESATTSALNSLAAAVATAREVALLSQQAQAVISGQQGTDSSNPYPVSQLFQQIAGQASGSQQTQIITSALASSSKGNEVIIAVTSPDSLQQAVLQSGITSSSQPGSVGVTDQTKVTYTIARPQGGGEEEVQFTVQPDIHFENQSAVADIQTQKKPTWRVTTCT